MERIRRKRVEVEEVEEVVEQDVESTEDDEEGTDKSTLDRIEARYRARAKTPLKAIRAFCVLCMGCQPRLVAKCTATNCPLYGFRFGTNPFQKRNKDVEEE